MNTDWFYCQGMYMQRVNREQNNTRQIDVNLMHV